MVMNPFNWIVIAWRFSSVILWALPHALGLLIKFLKLKLACMYGFLVYSSVGWFNYTDFLLCMMRHLTSGCTRSIYSVCCSAISTNTGSTCTALSWCVLKQVVFSMLFSIWHDNGVWLTNNRDGEISKW